MGDQKVRQTDGHSVRRQLLMASGRGLAGKAYRTGESLALAFGFDALVLSLRLKWQQRALKRCIGDLETLVGFEELKIDELLEIAEFLLQAGLGEAGLAYTNRAKDSQLNPSAETLALVELTVARIHAAGGNFQEADWRFQSAIGQFKAVPGPMSPAIQARILRSYAEFLRRTRGVHLAVKYEEEAMLIETELGAARAKQGAD